MFKQVRKFFVCIALFITMPILSGCIPLIVGAAAGASGYAWIRGVLVKQ